MRKWLKELRIKAGYNQPQVAKMAGITTQMYGFIENGKRSEPSKVDTEKKIAKALGFDWTRFFEDPPGGNTGAGG